MDVEELSRSYTYALSYIERLKADALLTVERMEAYAYTQVHKAIRVADAELTRLRAVIEGAPHEARCQSLVALKYRAMGEHANDLPCTCFKSQLNPQ